jgi:hypothetical protein
MPTVSPFYKTKQGPNPFYTMDEPTITTTKAALKKVGITVKPREEILFRCVDRIKGKTLIESRGQYFFQLAIDKNTNLPYGIKTTKKQVTGHLGSKQRKDSTASSNVNEFCTMYFMINKPMTPAQLEKHCTKMGNKSTGVLTGEGKPVTFDDLAELIDKDETPDRDIKIGLANARAVRKDIKTKSVEKYFWVPRGKPKGISPKTPSDVILKFRDGSFQGYSNKIAAGSDETPKFNTNITAYYDKLGNGGQLNNIKKLIDNSWNQAAREVDGAKRNAKKAIQAFDITREKFSETASSEEFGRLASKFRADGLDFYGEDFYYKFRNNHIKNLVKYLKDSRNLVYFLNTIYFYTYDDPRVSFTPCPYKLLVGRETGESTIKDVSADNALQNVLYNNKITKITQINHTYDGTSQAFNLNFTFDGKKVNIKITIRTRAAGGWQGKSLYINTPGVKFI